MNLSRTRKLVECGILLAIATVLSLIKLADLPYGGSITPASMLPVALIAYRHGNKWGLASGLVFGGIQQLLGLSVLGWVTTWQSILAVVLLDYIVAFAVIGLAGMFRKAVSAQRTSLLLGVAVCCVLRYLCHVASGATVWAGLSIPDSAALIYSLIYNATYMIPETVVLLIAAYAVGSLLDFRREQPVRLTQKQSGMGVMRGIALLITAAAVVFDVVAVFANLQNAESGVFDGSGLAAAPWLTMGIVTGCALVVAAVLFFLQGSKEKA